MTTATTAVSTAISVSGLVKTFGRTRALDEVGLTVRSGEVHGFLGPNGAGKATTIRVLPGLLRGDAGRVQVLGGDPWRDAVRRPSDRGIRSLVGHPPRLEEWLLRHDDCGQASAGAAAHDGQGRRPGASR
jgi:ABC-type sugar transport system ATPase subunit